MREIPLTQGYVALVDDGDYAWLSQWKWCVQVSRRTSYAARKSAGRNSRLVFMHREILGTAPGMQTDHRNGDGLDNQRTNLRECTSQQNQRNCRSRLGSSSRYLGVCWYKEKQKWLVQIRIDGHNHFLGLYCVEAEGAEVYKAAAAIAHGEFASGGRGDGVAVERVS